MLPYALADHDGAEVTRPDGTFCITEFVECSLRKVTYHLPAVPDRPSPPPLQSPLIVGRVEPSRPPEPDPERVAAVRRAEKSKRAGRRGGG